MKTRIIAALAVVGLVVGTSSADTFFSNDLTDGTAVAVDFNENISSHNNATWTYVADGTATDQDGVLNNVLTNGAVHNWVTVDDDTARSYLATKVSNYGDYSWTAHVAIENKVGKPYIFFGLGTGLPQESYYNEPRNGENVYMRFQSGNSNSKVMVLDDSGTTLQNTGLWRGDPGYDFWMHYNHIDQTIQFEIDDWNGGRFSDIDVTTDVISVTNSLSGAGDMRIFFGANAKVTWGDFSVIPEPATLGLVAVVGASALFIRRRFMI